MVGRTTAPTVDYWLAVAYDDHPYEMSWLLQSLTTSAGVAASGIYEVTELVVCCRSLSALLLVTSSSV